MIQFLRAGLVVALSLLARANPSVAGPPAAPAPPPGESGSPVVFGFERVAVSDHFPAVSSGELLVGEFNCVACHKAEKPVADRLNSKPPPLLGEVGKRVAPDYLRAFIADPHLTKPGTPMPDLLHGYDEKERTAVVDDLVHYLVSLGGPMKGAGKAGAPAKISKGDADKGRVLYHGVGCVACHAAQEGPAKVFPPDMGGPEGGGPKGPAADAVPEMKFPSVPLGNLAAKTDVGPLADFLRDPLRVRPGGRMPSLKLTSDEAKYVASYLLRDKVVPEEGQAPPAFVVDKEKAARGAKAFASVGCAACHQLADGKPAADSAVKAAPLADLNPALCGGCLDAKATKDVPLFKLTEPQRTAMVQALGRVKELAQPLDAKAQAVRTMAALNCFACHVRGDPAALMGGPEKGRNEYFRGLDRVDMGEEGQHPPHLLGVGRKLQNAWLHKVLEEGAAVRPYMATRMPQFGKANVEKLPEWFEQADAAPAKASHEAEVSEATVVAGRQMVGTQNGFGCINCHTIAGAASLGIPGIDLASTTTRLKHDWFHTFLHDPIGYRQGTRMPAFWQEGKSTLPQVLDGDERRQQDAVWAYLSLGNRMPLPPGVVGGGQYDLVPTKEPIVFRCFVNGVGAYAINVGYPEQTHVSFDGWNARLAQAWRGKFLTTKSTWEGRAGNPTAPAGGDLLAMPPGMPFARLDKPDAPWPAADGHDAGYQMLAYRLDSQRRPSFHYRYGDADVWEQPIPINTATAGGLTRSFTVAPGEAAMAFRAAVGEKVEVKDAKAGTFVVDGKQTVRVNLPEGAEAKVRAGAKGQELILTLPGKAATKGNYSFSVEILW